MDNISEHITYREATFSQTAIRHGLDNSPDESQIENMRLVALNVFEPARAHFKAIHGDVFRLAVSSFFRSPVLNSIVGGAKNSQHKEGKAIDIDAERHGFITNADLFNYIRDNLQFDQLIWEYGTATSPSWVHVSWNKEGNRNQIIYIA